MDQLAIVARLKPGAEPRAAELIGRGAPFDPEAIGLRRHTIFLSAGEVVFVFEGDEVEWTVDGLVDEPFHWDLHAAFEDWRDIVEEQPRIARVAYSWAAQSREKLAPFHG
ncbi:MAG TPA: hypothetical protein VLB89_02850 [Gaiellaceae bacterium]|nr:hypothetical protein [Gaiellaceae bacterium]